MITDHMSRTPEEGQNINNIDTRTRRMLHARMTNDCNKEYLLEIRLNESLVSGLTGILDAV